MAQSWWMGGVASALASVATHPLDSLKVRLQTAPTAISSGELIIAISKEDGGLLTLYKGVDAAILRQLTYSSARFAVYDQVKTLLMSSALLGSSPLLVRIFAATAGGIVGGIAGSPADLVNVRMQIDGKLPPTDRRNYANVISGIIAIVSKEGPFALFNGLSANILRAVLMTAGQIATFDTVKNEMIGSAGFSDSIFVQFIASIVGALVATTLCSPVDVVKSRLMSQSEKKKLYSGAIDAIQKISHNEGYSAFFNGWFDF
ncbi:Mitochondrial dicarboxylate transporter [Physocladia obscura]|uniref:Mitochondrial dicarboxylate transporter n=1 Tax=Physocladia obscura TaxID=109957 RepID=A0AAD5T7S3_9FUNG|nr:Mitochondrial dicarboxylate transporter [Physocladia obscura]